MRIPIRPALLTAALLLAGCDAAGDRHVLTIEATGTVVGVAYIDRDGDLEVSPSVDTPLADARVSLVHPGTDRSVADATTDAEGVYRIASVPVGRYELRVDPAVLGDSLRVVRSDSAGFSVLAHDTVAVSVALGYPAATVAGARALPTGRTVTLEAVALNGSATFSDGAVHVADSTGVIRVLVGGAQPAVAEGDTVRVVGRTAVRDAQPVLTGASLRTLRPGEHAPPEALTTAVAAAADGGRLDAALVRVAGTTIIESQSIGGGSLRLTVNDGSGPLQVLLDGRAGITSPTPFSTGAVLDAVGLLAPRENEPGRWRLKPRGSDDVVVTIPTLTVAEARELPVGRRVSVEGLALNGWATFGDGSVHLVDPTGAIRAVQVPSAFLFAGDSLRVVGVIGVRDGQAALTQVTTTILGHGALPPPHDATTGTAADANGGRWDAALVRVHDAEITDTATVGNDFQLTVDDGSGALEVRIARDTGIGRAPFVPGATVRATGVLVPLPGGTEWRLQPRSRDDLAVQ